MTSVAAATIGCAAMAPKVGMPVTAELGAAVLFGSAIVATDDLSATFSAASADESIRCRGTVQLLAWGEVVGSATCSPGDGEYTASGLYSPDTRLMTLVLL